MRADIIIALKHSLDNFCGWLKKLQNSEHSPPQKLSSIW